MDNSGPDDQDAAAEGVLLELADDADELLLSFLPAELFEVSEEVPLLDDSLFDSLLVSPLGTAPARLSVR